jgi:hypothetical protein
LDDRDSYWFRLPGHCGILTAEMCAIQFACNLTESQPVGAYTLFSRIALPIHIERLKSTGVSYLTNDMLFRTRRSLKYLVEHGYDKSLRWIPFHVDIQGNEWAGVVANEGLFSGIFFQDQAGLTTVNTSDIHTCARTRLLTEWQER